MTDALAAVIHTNLELHFGRAAHRSPDPSEGPDLVAAVVALLQQIDAQILQIGDGEPTDTTVLARLFTSDDALPAWLVNKALIRCNNNRHKLETAMLDVLAIDINRRRFLDYCCAEMLYRCWNWSNERERRRWPLVQTRTASSNAYCLELNKHDYVVKLEGDIINRSDKQSEIYHWYVRSIGTATLFDYATPTIFEYTARLIEGKYKTSFILDVFKELFKQAYQGPAFDRFGVLVVGDIVKTFALTDYQEALEAACDPDVPTDRSVLPLFAHIIERFDAPCQPDQPEARFRVGIDPPRELLDKVGTMFWMRRTLDAVKRLQQKKAPPTRGMLVEERTVLAAALEQKSLLYFRLFDDPTDSAINPCHILSLGEEAMELQSPRGNRLNQAQPGDEVHGYFSVNANGQKNTFCDFRSNIVAVRQEDDTCCQLTLAIPAAFELTRRTHKRLRLEPNQLAVFELSSPAPDADWNLFGNLTRWPAPLCIIPDSACHGHIKDLSAGGLMLEIHHEAPACDYFIESNRDYPLLAHLHLVDPYGSQELNLALRLEIKRIRDIPQVRKKYVGFQFTDAGEVRNDRLVRFAPVGKDGIFLINDWIFRATLGRS